MSVKFSLGIFDPSLSTVTKLGIVLSGFNSHALLFFIYLIFSWNEIRQRIISKPKTKLCLLFLIYQPHWYIKNVLKMFLKSMEVLSLTLTILYTALRFFFFLLLFNGLFKWHMKAVNSLSTYIKMISYRKLNWIN